MIGMSVFLFYYVVLFGIVKNQTGHYCIYYALELSIKFELSEQAQVKVLTSQIIIDFSLSFFLLCRRKKYFQIR